MRPSSSPTTTAPRRILTAYQDLHSVRFGYRAGSRISRRPGRAPRGSACRSSPPRGRGRRSAADQLELDSAESRADAHRFYEREGADYRSISFGWELIGGSAPMAGRTILFGATGYTGTLTAEAMVARGDRPVLAARSAEKLAPLSPTSAASRQRSRRLRAGVGSRPARAGRRDRRHGRTVRRSATPPSRRRSTPGPRTSTRPGSPPSSAASSSTTGRRRRAGAGLVTAFGYDWVPGNLAAGLALREAGEAATRVDIGYFATGNGLGGMSGERRASLAGALIEPAFAYRDGPSAPSEAPPRALVRGSGPGRDAISVGSSEHFTLPKIHPGLREVDAYLGWFGSRSKMMSRMSAVNAGIVKVPGVKSALGALTRRFVKGSTGGPDAEARAGTGRRSSRSPTTTAGTSSPRSRSPASTATSSPGACSPGARREPPRTASKAPARSVRSTDSASTRSSPAARRRVSSASPRRPALPPAPEPERAPPTASCGRRKRPQRTLPLASPNRRRPQ